MKKYDADGNGKLDAAEFRHMVTDLRQWQFRRTEGGGYVNDDNVYRVFHKFDHNGDESIDNAELREALSYLHLTVTGEQAETLLKRYDRDH